ncbi:hypothetical protein ACJIZ3_011403 [Penstemon smallii]|uniref:Uncharacterized protein n=1 Tax=Penstemon smallii TaxID=265156 RepID=A0ABD3UKQ1_9LAMI
MGRAPCCDKANVKKGPWSPEEDTKLKDFIHKFGTGGNWIALPQKAGLRRCGKSCRLRWLNYLRPNIKHGEFSEEEDRIICTLYASIGSRWSIIAGQLHGRTDNDIKNYWNTKLKKKLIMGSIMQPKPFSPTFQTQYSQPLYKDYNSINHPQPTKSLNAIDSMLDPQNYLYNNILPILSTPSDQYSYNNYDIPVEENMLMFGNTTSSSYGKLDHVIIKQEENQEFMLHYNNEDPLFSAFLDEKETANDDDNKTRESRGMMYY